MAAARLPSSHVIQGLVLRTIPEHRRVLQRRRLPSMPVVLDPDAAAVSQGLPGKASRPAYETLTAPEAREYYRAARVVCNPEPPALRTRASRLA